VRELDKKETIQAGEEWKYNKKWQGGKEEVYQKAFNDIWPQKTLDWWKDWKSLPLKKLIYFCSLKFSSPPNARITQSSYTAHPPKESVRIEEEGYLTKYKEVFTKVMLWKWDFTRPLKITEGDDLIATPPQPRQPNSTSS